MMFKGEVICSAIDCGYNHYRKHICTAIGIIINSKGLCKSFIRKTSKSEGVCRKGYFFGEYIRICVCSPNTDNECYDCMSGN